MRLKEPIASCPAFLATASENHTPSNRNFDLPFLTSEPSLTTNLPQDSLRHPSLETALFTLASVTSTFILHFCSRRPQSPSSLTFHSFPRDELIHFPRDDHNHLSSRQPHLPSFETSSMTTNLNHDSYTKNTRSLLLPTSNQTSLAFAGGRSHHLPT